MSENRKCQSCAQDLPELASEKWSFFIPIEPPSLNAVSGNKGGYGARAKYKKIRDAYKYAIRERRMYSALDLPGATGRRRVYVTRCMGKGKRRYDRDNLIGGCKPLMDALTLSGLLLDDKEKYLEAHYHQVRADKGASGGVLIEIEEMGND